MTRKCTYICPQCGSANVERDMKSAQCRNPRCLHVGAVKSFRYGGPQPKNKIKSADAPLESLGRGSFRKRALLDD